MFDGYGREIDYLRISITDKCNLRCKYCMPEDIESLPMKEILSYEEILHDDDRIFAYIRESDAGKAIVLINLSDEKATYDASVVEDAELILGTEGESSRGELAPFEAVIYERSR